MSDAADDAVRARAASAWLERERAHLLREWLAAGGDEAEFREVWEGVRAQLIAQRLDSVGGRARNRSLVQSRFNRPFTTPRPALPTTDELNAGVDAGHAPARTDAQTTQADATPAPPDDPPTER